jgi:predicted Zn-dependent protease
LEDALALAQRLLDTDPALAAQQASEILRVFGAHPIAAWVLGASQRRQGLTLAALQTLGPLAASQPRAALVHFELGLALMQTGDSKGAIQSLQQAVRLKPDLPQAWRVLGDQFAALGDVDAADAAYAAHVRFSTRDPRLLAAGAALHSNDLPQAESLLRAHLHQAPTDVAALRMMAELAARLGRQEDAEALLVQCLKLAPGFRAARQNLAMVLHRGNKPKQALEHIDLLLGEQPHSANMRNLKAVVLCRIGSYDDAIALYDGLVSEHPQQARLWLSLGHALKTAGHTPRAIDAYRRSLALEPARGEIWWSLANLKTFKFSDDDVRVMQDQLAQSGLSNEDVLQLHFALGKALEDREGYAASFAHYAEGNAIRREQLRYSAEDTTARVAKVERTYTTQFFADRQGCGSSSPDPIFVLGLPRAGSTLIEQILSSHSAVEGTMELPEVISMTRELRVQARDGQTLPYHDVLAGLSGDELRALGEQYLSHTRIHRKTNTPFFIDKMPNNFQHIGLIHLMLPNAKIIDARRHPLACCFSGFKQHFARGQAFTYSLDDIGRYYRDYVRLMAHFDSVLPDRVHRVHYEAMVDDTEMEVRRLLDYCGLPFEEGCLRFFENKRAVRTASSEQVRQPVYRDGIDQWRHFEPWLSPLKDALGPVLDAYPAVPKFQHAASH